MAKLFGNTGGAHTRTARRAVSPAPQLPRWARITACALALTAALYGFVVWAPIRPVRYLRDLYIETALSTMSHRWLATAFFPKSVVEQVRLQMNAVVDSQSGLTSQWGNSDPAPDVPDDPLPAPEGDEPRQLGDKREMEAFFTLFHQLDRQQVLDWVADDPTLLEKGWSALKVNEAGLEDDGLPIHTARGDQVLAIDAKNGILLVRVKGATYRGVLAIAADPARLTLQAAATIGEVGQNAGVIAKDHNGLLAMTASGFLDADGKGKGGTVTGFARCDGVDYGEHLQGGYRRLEKHSDQRLYLTGAVGPVSDQATDAMEFTPALIVDGRITVDDSCGWTAMNPRACLGQTDKLEMLLLVIEGRLPTISLGASVVTCADILADYGGVQAMNMDGGTSAILWYEGEYITQCSNTALTAGRLLPNAWVYEGKE